LKVLEEELWAQTTWADIRASRPDAKVLARKQLWSPPEGFPRYEGELPAAVEQAPPEAIAPRWGENTALGKDGG
jgi:hypothetical protein